MSAYCVIFCGINCFYPKVEPPKHIGQPPDWEEESDEDLRRILHDWETQAGIRNSSAYDIPLSEVTFPSAHDPLRARRPRLGIPSFQIIQINVHDAYTSCGGGLCNIFMYTSCGGGLSNTMCRPPAEEVDTDVYLKQG